MAKYREWTLAELNEVFNKHDASLRAMATFSPDMQGVMFDVDKKTGAPFARVVLAKKGTTKPSDIPANIGGLAFKGEYNR